MMAQGAWTGVFRTDLVAPDPGVGPSRQFDAPLKIAGNHVPQDAGIICVEKQGDAYLVITQRSVTGCVCPNVVAPDHIRRVDRATAIRDINAFIRVAGNHVSLAGKPSTDEIVRTKDRDAIPIWQQRRVAGPESDVVGLDCGRIPRDKDFAPS